MSQAKEKLSLEGFNVLDQSHPAAHEFIRGEARPRVQPGRVHTDVVMNLIGALLGALRGTPVRVYGDSLRVQVGEEAILYPDISVTSDPDDMKGRTLKSPSLIVEVLSSQTQNFDRGPKFAAYRKLPGLLEYVMVDPETQWVELFRRSPEGAWTLHDVTDDTLLLASVGTELSMNDIFGNLGSD